MDAQTVESVEQTNGRPGGRTSRVTAAHHVCHDRYGVRSSPSYTSWFVRDHHFRDKHRNKFFKWMGTTTENQRAVEMQKAAKMCSGDGGGDDGDGGGPPDLESDDEMIDRADHGSIASTECPGYAVGSGLAEADDCLDSLERWVVLGRMGAKQSKTKKGRLGDQEIRQNTLWLYSPKCQLPRGARGSAHACHFVSSLTSCC